MRQPAMEIDARTRAGQAVYTRRMLKFYDLFVLGLSNRFLWRCPTLHLEALYQRNVSAEHLDIGVGTGYFLDRVQWPDISPAITLVDLNAQSLAAAVARIARFGPKQVTANCLEPLPDLGRFGSVGLCYLLHCLPGNSIAQKAVVFDNVLPQMAPGASLFGATIVQGDVPRSLPAQRLMDFYNRKGIFSNAGDCREDLKRELEERFDDVQLQQVGIVAIFEARRRG